MGAWDGLVNQMETKPRADGASLNGANGEGGGGGGGGGGSCPTSSDRNPNVG